MTMRPEYPQIGTAVDRVVGKVRAVPAITPSSRSRRGHTMDSAPLRRAHQWLAFLFGAMLLNSCTSNMPTGSPTTLTSIAGPPLASLAPASGLANCTAEEVRLLVDRFLHAFNVGDQGLLQQLWSQEGQGYDWYTTDAPGQRIGPAASDRATLMSYFADRHTRREELRLTSFRFNGNSASYGNFEYTLLRQADDLTPTAYGGKGGAVCNASPRTIGVWSMAREERPPTT